MKVRHQIEAQLYHYSDGILPGAEEFISKYAPYRVEPTTTYIFSDESKLAEAMSLLAKHGLEAEKFYDFEIEPNELETYPALYLGTYTIFDLFILDEEAEWVDASVLNEYEMVQDYESERIVVSPRVKKVLEKITQKVGWESVERTDKQQWFLMEVVELLPEPIIIPFPVSVEPNEDPPGTYAVRSDGRDVATQANISKLTEVGIAVSLEVKAQEKMLKWRPRLVASGKVIYALQSAGIKDILDFTSPLIGESHPLSR